MAPKKGKHPGWSSDLYIDTDIHTACKGTCMHIHAPYARLCMHVHKYTETWALQKQEHVYSHTPHIKEHACIHIHICTPHVWEHTCTHIHMCSTMHAYICTHTYHMWRSMHVCTYIYTLYAQEHTHTYTVCTTCAATYMYAHVLKHPLVRRQKLLGKNAS